LDGSKKARLSFQKKAPPYHSAAWTRRHWDRPANTAARSSPVHACSRSLGLPTATAAADKRKAASWCTAQQSASKTAGSICENCQMEAA